MKYKDFLKNKVVMADHFGFDISDDEIHPILKLHQRALVRWGVSGGRRAYFSSFGLGKTVIQLESLRLVLKHLGGGKALLVCPLGVRQEFKDDAVNLLDMPEPKFIRTTAELDGDGIYLTNYESVREGKIDLAEFAAGSLDEAAILRGYGTKTYQEFLPLFDCIPFRFVATATPDPNRYKELIHYAGFLGIMDTGQALTRFFQRDSTQANNLTLYPHMEKEFWLWVNSWAAFLQKPSDLGFDDEGYELPELRIHYHEVKVDITDTTADRDGQIHLFRDSAVSLQDAAREKRESLAVRIEAMREILDENPERHALLWHDLEDERRAIKKAVPDAVEVYGAQDIDLRERNVVAFKEGEFKYLASKPELSGAGCNFQKHCSMAVFVGIGYKFHDFIQAIHRIYRFLQHSDCDIHIIYAETEREILRALQDKWKRHNEQVEKMSEIIKEHGLSIGEMAETLQRSIGVERIEAKGENYLVSNNDCVEEARTVETDSVGLIVTSIPFSNHYEYTPSYNDFGHTKDNDHFWAQMDYLTPELLRILQPGRIYACHVKDRINFGNVTGAGIPTVSPFHVEATMHGIKHGFDYMGMITVVTDVVRENNQTYRLGWSEQCKDGSKMGVGSPEYILLFHKPQTDRSRGYADLPITKSKDEYSRARWQVDAHAFWRSSGNRNLTPEELAKLPPDKISKLFTEQTLKEIYSYDSHIQIGEELDGRGALPSTFMTLAPASHDSHVWHDVNRMLTLNGEQTKKGLNNHICPLQFDIVDRIINRYSNKGELVYDPFGGLFTVPYRAMHLGRKGRASELNPQYFLDGVAYLEAKERELSVPDLFADIDC